MSLIDNLTAVFIDTSNLFLYNIWNNLGMLFWAVIQKKMIWLSLVSNLLYFGSYSFNFWQGLSNFWPFFEHLWLNWLAQSIKVYLALHSKLHFWYIFFLSDRLGSVRKNISLKLCIIIIIIIFFFALQSLKPPTIIYLLYTCLNTSILKSR